MVTRTSYLAIALIFFIPALVARADDAADVKAAARAFLVASQQADSTRMKQLVTADSQEVIDPMVAFIKAGVKLNAASVAKFGVRIAEGQVSDKDLKKFDDSATVTVEGDQASVQVGSKNSSPILLQKEDGVWKLSLRQNGVDLNKFFEIAATAAIFTADEIEAGKYETAAKAKAAYNQKIGKGIKSAGMAK